MKEPTSFADCEALGATRKRKLCNNTYLVLLPDGSWGIRLHQTAVVVYHADGRITLNSGGYKTVTTKERMNRYSPFSVWSVRGVWYAMLEECQYVYADGLTLHAGGIVTGEGEDPRLQQKERKAAAEFAKAYVAELAAGNVPAPSGADCFGCSMVAADGSHPMGGRDHMLGHLSKDERYYVPSIAVNAAKRFGVSIAGKHWISVCFEADSAPIADDWLGGVASDQVRRSIKRWVLSELGHAV